MSRTTEKPGDGAARHLDPFTVQLPPDFANAVDAVVVGVDAADVLFELFIAQSAGAGPPALKQFQVLR